MKKNSSKKESGIQGIVGVGLDNNDGHNRVTRSEHFLLVGGSEEVHGKMQDTAIYFAEALKKEGTPLSETPVEKVVDILMKSMEK